MVVGDLYNVGSRVDFSFFMWINDVFTHSRREFYIRSNFTTPPIPYLLLDKINIGPCGFSWYDAKIYWMVVDKDPMLRGAYVSFIARIAYKLWSFTFDKNFDKGLCRHNFLSKHDTPW